MGQGVKSPGLADRLASMTKALSVSGQCHDSESWNAFVTLIDRPVYAKLDSSLREGLVCSIELERDSCWSTLHRTGGLR